MQKYIRKKWKKYYDLPEIEEIRALIKDTYSNKLQFIEETHQYFLDGIEYECVSNITHRYKPVSQDEMAEMSYRKGLKYPNYKYAGMAKEEILELWKANAKKACDFGTTVHEFGEGMFYYMAGEEEKIPSSCKDKFIDGVPHPSNNFESAIVQFWKDIPDCIVPVLAETKVFNKFGTSYAGTFDILFYYIEYPNSPKNGLIIFDYKTNGALADTSKAFNKLRENFGGTKLLYPFNDLLSCDESYYKLQLACYQIPLENIGLKVIARRIIWLHPDGTYEKISEPNMANRMREALNIKNKEEIFNMMA